MKNLIVYILIILIVLAGLGVSWLIVCGLTKLICWCFGITYTWKIGTGVWLILSLFSAALGTKNNN